MYKLIDHLCTDLDNAGPLHVYPRLCLVDWADHSHAAFYPPVSLMIHRYNSSIDVTEYEMEDSHLFEDDSVFLEADTDFMVSEKSYVLEFVSRYLKEPDAMRAKTLHF